MDSNQFIFEDISPQECQVKIGTKEYVLREAGTGAAVKYQNLLQKGTRYENGRPVGIDGIADAGPMLLSQCLFEKYESGGGTKTRPVLLSTILDWPPRVVEPMVKWVRDTSKIDSNNNEEVIEKQIAELQALLETIRAAKVNGADDVAVKN